MMETDDSHPVLSTSTKSSLNISLHPLPILSISEHLTRLKLQTRKADPFVLGALLGTQNGRDLEIVNTFELAVLDSAAGSGDGTGTSTAPPQIDHEFFASRRDQYKQVFPSLDFIGWYTVAPQLSSSHIQIHSELTQYTPSPVLLVLSPTTSSAGEGGLPFKTYEPILEIRDRKSHTVYVEGGYKVETGEAERIAVDWTARGGGEASGLTSHLQTQRAAIKMLHDRILLLVEYVTRVIAGTAQKDHETLRSLAALVASLPASANPHFREEFETERADVLLTTYLATLTKSQNALNEVVDKYLILATGDRDRDGGPGGRGKRRGMGMGMGFVDGPFGGGGGRRGMTLYE